MVETPFSKQMRKATREIHDVSDALVNAKLAFAMSENSVWAEGLLVFYEVFRYLEEAMERLKGTPVAEFKLPEMMRTDAFQRDLEFYLGNDWSKDYNPRESVVKYLIHLQEIEKKQPILLIAYIYHLYMGLLSGGQILSKKRALMKKLTPFRSHASGGDAVTSFGDHTIASIKKQVVETTNAIASTLDNDTKEKLLEESKLVFLLNNAMVKSIQGATYALLKKVMIFIAFVVFVIMLYIYCL